ncbi:MAG: hypothetical protein H8K05_00090, partial [Nitrospira sp.]|nr:hypothetical protein [Nitrospira sp.]
LAKKRVKEYEIEKVAIKSFKDRMNKAIKAIRSAGPSKDKPIVFFIDELDRGRPTYAIELLERIKHVFDIESIVFVIAIDKMQLGHSIRAVYGKGLDVDGYLRRFLDLEYSLPDPPTAHFQTFLAEQYQIKKLARAVHPQAQDISGTVDCFSCFADIFNLSLRTQEQCFATMSIILMTCSPLEAMYLPLIGALLAIRAHEGGQWYHRLLSGEANANQILDMIKTNTKGREYLGRPEGQSFEAAFLSVLKHTDSSANSMLSFAKSQSLHPAGDPPNFEILRYKRITQLAEGHNVNAGFFAQIKKALSFLVISKEPSQGFDA